MPTITVCRRYIYHGVYHERGRFRPSNFPRLIRYLFASNKLMKAFF
jgi:hypothetical protein